MLYVSEEEFIFQLKSKNATAFRYLYDAYAPALLGSIVKVIPCSETAQDILQNVMLKIWSNTEKYDAAKGRLFTWMINITRNETMDYFRSKGYRLSALSDIHFEEPSPDSSSVEALLTQLDIRKLLKQLPQKERSILELISRGFTCKETALLLKLPEGTVKTKIRSSYRKLRLALQN